MERTEKIPIDEYGWGNCCPECGSTKVVCYMQFPIVKMYDMRDKEIIRDKKGKRIYRPSNKLLARKYKNCEAGECQCTNYVCEKCGWKSEMFSAYSK